MKARLNSGEIITLVKDCECVTHEGPHFLHMNEFDKLASREIFRRVLSGEWNPPTAEHAAEAAMISEAARLQRLQYAMESRGIAELIDE